MRWLLVCGLIFLSTSAQAEYRVFRLKIQAAPEEPGGEAAVRYELSVLDPIQYREYFHVTDRESVTYVETWRCRGRTDNFKPLCPNPREAAASEELTVTPAAPGKS